MKVVVFGQITHPAEFHYRLLCTGDFIFSSSYDKTVKAWLFDTSELDDGSEDKACIRTFKGHSKGVYPLIFIPGLILKYLLPI